MFTLGHFSSNLHLTLNSRHHITDLTNLSVLWQKCLTFTPTTTLACWNLCIFWQNTTSFTTLLNITAKMTILSDICQKWFMCRPNGLLPCWNLNIFWHNSSTSFLSLCHFMVILVVINVLRHSLLVLKPIAMLHMSELSIF